jgi:carboxymethylenebutenolidase
LSLKQFSGWEFFLAKGTKPVGLVVIHEIYGYDTYVESVATELSSSGFTAAAIDLFRGKRATGLDEGMKLRTSVTKEILSDGISRGVEMIRKETGARRFGTLGFCMGGGFALQAACDLGLDFCVDFYGSIPNESDVSGLKGPVLLILGSEDERVTPWAMEKFLPAAKQYKKRVEVQLYPNARHAFHRPGWEGHNPEAAKDAWDKTVRFLSQLAQS